MTYFFYKFLKIYTRFGLRFYFRKWQIRSLDPIPDGPVIFVSNHQNAFLDAFLAICGTHRDIWFLTRGNIFGKPRVRKILHFLKMTPVYRFRDGFGSLRKNDEVLDTCIDLLSQREPLLIFAEGNHDDRWHLRPMQKGFARIALAAEEKNNWALDLKIVPVGIQYDSPTVDFRSRVLVTYGHTIHVKDLVFPVSNPVEAIDKLMETVRNELQPFILNIGLDDYPHKFALLRARQLYKRDLVEQLHADQKILETISVTPGSPPPNLPQKKYPWWNPVFLYNFINQLLPWALLRWIIKNKVTDPQFNSSVTMSVGMFLVPMAYILQTVICFYISGSWLISGIYFISLPLSLLLRRS